MPINTAEDVQALIDNGTVMEVLMSETKIVPSDGGKGKIKLRFQMPLWFSEFFDEATQQNIGAAIAKHAQAAYNATKAEDAPKEPCNSTMGFRTSEEDDAVQRAIGLSLLPESEVERRRVREAEAPKLSGWAAEKARRASTEKWWSPKAMDWIDRKAADQHGATRRRERRGTVVSKESHHSEGGVARDV